MSTIGIMRSLSSHRWQDAIRSLRQNAFATWIVARWALLGRERRHAPQRDFKTSRRSAWREPTLSMQVVQASSLYSTWNFAFYLASSPSSDVLAFSRHVHPRRQLQSSQSNTFPLGSEQVRLKLTASLRSHPVHFHLWTSLRIDSGVMLSQSVMNSTMTLLSLLQTFEERTDRTVYHHAQFIGGVHSKIRLLAQSWRLTSVLDSQGNGPAWVSRRVSSLSNAPHFYSALFRSAASTSRFAFATILFRSHTNSLSHATSIQQLIKHQDRMMTLSVDGKNVEERPQHSQLMLQLRTEVEPTDSRPAMHFVQAAPSNQPELLSAIQRMETAVTKYQSSQTPATTSGPDIQRLTSQVYDQFERQLRIERERRGR